MQIHRPRPRRDVLGHEVLPREVQENVFGGAAEKEGTRRGSAEKEPRVAQPLRDAREERDRRGAEAEAGEALHRLLVHGLGLALELERREDEEARRDAEEAEAEPILANQGG